jgi:putative transposase
LPGRLFIPKYRKKALCGELRRRMGDMFRSLATQKECQISEGHLMPDHVHMLISIPPKHSVAQVIGYIKGKSTIHVARTFFEQAQLRGAAFLGTGILRLDRWPRRRSHPRVHLSRLGRLTP